MSAVIHTAPGTRKKFRGLNLAQRKAKLREAWKKYRNDASDMDIIFSDHWSDDSDIDMDWLEGKKSVTVPSPTERKRLSSAKATKKEPPIKSPKKVHIQAKRPVIQQKPKSFTANGADKKSPAKLKNVATKWETKNIESNKPVTTKEIKLDISRSKVSEVKPVIKSSMSPNTSHVKQRGRIPFDMKDDGDVDKEASEPQKVDSLLSLWENKKQKQQNGYDALQDEAFSTNTMGRLKGAKALFENMSKSGSLPSRSFKSRPESPKKAAAPVNDVRSMFESKAKQEDVTRNPSLKRSQRPVLPKRDAFVGKKEVSSSKEPLKSPVKPRPVVPVKPPILSPKSTQRPREYSEADSLEGIFSNEELSDVSSLSMTSSEDEDVNVKKRRTVIRKMRKKRASERNENSLKQEEKGSTNANEDGEKPVTGVPADKKEEASSIQETKSEIIPQTDKSTPSEESQDKNIADLDGTPEKDKDDSEKEESLVQDITNDGKQEKPLSEGENTPENEASPEGENAPEDEAYPEDDNAPKNVPSPEDENGPENEASPDENAPENVAFPEDNAPENVVSPEDENALENKSSPDESASENVASPEDENAPENEASTEDDHTPEDENAPENEAFPDDNAPENEASPADENTPENEAYPEDDNAPENVVSLEDENAPEIEASPDKNALENTASPEDESAPENEDAPEDKEESLIKEIKDQTSSKDEVETLNTQNNEEAKSEEDFSLDAERANEKEETNLDAAASDQKIALSVDTNEDLKVKKPEEPVSDAAFVDEEKTVSEEGIEDERSIQDDEASNHQEDDALVGDYVEENEEFPPDEEAKEEESVLDEDQAIERSIEDQKDAVPEGEFNNEQKEEISDQETKDEIIPHTEESTPSVERQDENILDYESTPKVDPDKEVHEDRSLLDLEKNESEEEREFVPDVEVIPEIKDASSDIAEDQHGSSQDLDGIKPQETEEECGLDYEKTPKENNIISSDGEESEPLQGEENASPDDEARSMHNVEEITLQEDKEKCTSDYETISEENKLCSDEEENKMSLPNCEKSQSPESESSAAPEPSLTHEEVNPHAQSEED